MKFSRITGSVVLMIGAQSLASMRAGAAEADLNQAGAIPAESSPRSGNPVFDGWYADPEAALFGNQYWIYPTYSAKYNQQVFFDAFSFSRPYARTVNS